MMLNGQFGSKEKKFTLPCPGGGRKFIEKSSNRLILKINWPAQKKIAVRSLFCRPQRSDRVVTQT